eukprot:g40271.t1
MTEERCHGPADSSQVPTMLSYCRWLIAGAASLSDGGSSSDGREPGMIQWLASVTETVFRDEATIVNNYIPMTFKSY